MDAASRRRSQLPIAIGATAPPVVPTPRATYSAYASLLRRDSLPAPLPAVRGGGGSRRLLVVAMAVLMVLVMYRGSGSSPSRSRDAHLASDHARSVSDKRRRQREMARRRKAALEEEEATDAVGDVGAAQVDDDTLDDDDDEQDTSSVEGAAQAAVAPGVATQAAAAPGVVSQAVAAPAAAAPAAAAPAAAAPAAAASAAGAGPAAASSFQALLPGAHGDRRHPVLFPARYVKEEPLPQKDCEPKWGNSYLRSFLDSRYDSCVPNWSALSEAEARGMRASRGLMEERRCVTRGGCQAGLHGALCSSSSRARSPAHPPHSSAGTPTVVSRITSWKVHTGANMHWMRNVAVDFGKTTVQGDQVREGVCREGCGGVSAALGIHQGPLSPHPCSATLTLASSREPASRIT